MYFKDFQTTMLDNSEIKITRIAWNTINKWIFWNKETKVFDIYSNGIITEWCWEDTMTYEDLTSSDWKKI